MALTDSLEAWYQFDDSQNGNGNTLPNEVIDGDGLIEDDVSASTDADYVTTNFGIEQAARYIGTDNAGNTETDTYHWIENSESNTHWSNPPTGEVLTGFIAFETVSQPNSFNTRTIVGRYWTNTLASWRIACRS